MSTPRTTIDTRFSDPEATATPWSETRRVLETAELFWITTVRADGRPHVTPLVAVWLDDAIHFSTGETEQKAMNLRVNRHVVLTTGCNTWTEGLDVVVEGDAVAVTDDAVLSRLATTWSHKWDGRCTTRSATALLQSRRRRGRPGLRRGAGEGARLRQGNLHAYDVPILIRGTPSSRGRMTRWPSTRSTSALSRARSG